MFAAFFVENIIIPAFFARVETCTVPAFFADMRNRLIFSEKYFTMVSRYKYRNTSIKIQVSRYENNGK